MQDDEKRSFGRRYSDLKSLGSGAQGIVYVGKDRFLKEEKVAIKALRPMVNEAWRDALIHEFEVLAGLSHQRLARVHDFGTTEDERVYFTRDYVEGEDLRSATAYMDGKSILITLVEVCRALKPLHSRGLLHGDLKPGNIIISNPSSGPNATGPVAHLIDFSFVCASGDDAKRQGTVQYMAPEVIEGKPVDPRADLYALGITIIDILFGSPPYNGKVSDIIEGHLSPQRPALDPSKARIQKGAKALVVDLISVAQKLMSRHPNDRYPDVWEAEAALTKVAENTQFSDPLPEYPVVNDPMGRNAEFERIRKALERRLTSPGEQAALKVILGEIGTGKEALLRNVKWWAQLNGIAVLEARSASLLSPIARWVDQALDHMQSDAVALNLGEYLASQLKKPDLAGTNIDRLTKESTQLLLDLARKQKLLIELGDLDHASAETIHVLSGLLAQADPSIPIAVLVTAEPQFPWRAKLGPGDAFTLPVLTREQVTRLAGAFLGKADPDVVERIVSHTGGNPVFVETLLKDLASSGRGAEQLEKLGPPGKLENYWHHGLSEMPTKQRDVLLTCAVIDRAATLKEIANVAGVGLDGLESRIENLKSAGWIRRGPDGWYVSTFPMAREVLSTANPKELEKRHRKAAKIENSEAKQLLHAARGQCLSDVEERGLKVALSLEDMGALQAALELLTELERVIQKEPERDAVRLALGRVYLAQGNYDAVVEHLAPLAKRQGNQFQSSALLHLGTMHSIFGRLDESTKALKAVLDIASTPSEKARALRELANVEFKRGDLTKCNKTAQKGLAFAPERDTVRADLLMVLAKKCAHEGLHGEALARTREAVREAAEIGDRSCLASAVDMHSWVLGQAGDLVAAVSELKKAVNLYRELGNLPKLMRDQLALGDMNWRLERWSEALAHYEEASRLTATVSNPVEALLAEIGLGQALIKTGRFERAMLVIGQARTEAKRLEQEELLVHAMVYEGDLLACRGDVDDAVAKYRQAHQGFERLLERAVEMDSESATKGGWTRWQAALADLELELSGWLLWRGKTKDPEEAKVLIESAAKRNREDKGRHFEENLTLRKATLAIAEGRAIEGIEWLDEICQRASKTPFKDIRWQANLTAARGYLKMNSDILARRRLRQAESDLNALSHRFTNQQQLAFWQDVRRAEVRALLNSTTPSSELSSSLQLDRTDPKLDSETRALYRILDFNQQLSKEHELPRLLEAILDAAVELTGAERGLLLMAPGDGDGTLSIAASKPIDAAQPQDPHGRFSRSIAESVHLDGEPVVTLDAMGDERFNEFISIHELKLRSVACVPVRYRDEGLGVLYLENRLNVGRFGGSDLRVLSAFSDQVAIAIAQTRLLEESQRREIDIRNARRAIEEICEKQTEHLHAKDTDLKLAQDRLARMRELLSGKGNFHGAVGTTSVMGRIFSMVDRIKDLDVPVVLVGESGTGKDLLARIIHDEGTRKEGPFVVLNCGTIPESLMESTLFGHKKGTFSGAASDQKGILEAAGQGTLYLDEIGDMSPRMQVNLLRVLQEERFTPLGASHAVASDFRLIASSKTPLSELVESSSLRRDLMYRLQVVTVEIPPLRARREDILPLARCLIEREADQSNQVRRTFSKAAVDSLCAHKWPGNVRELEQILRRVILVGENTGPISAQELGLDAQEHRVPSTQTGTGKPKDTNVDEKTRILNALERCKWNRTHAAKELGIPRRTFYRKLNKYGIHTKG